MLPLQPYEHPLDLVNSGFNGHSPSRTHWHAIVLDPAGCQDSSGRIRRAGAYFSGQNSTQLENEEARNHIIKELGFPSDSSGYLFQGGKDDAGKVPLRKRRRNSVPVTFYDYYAEQFSAEVSITPETNGSTPSEVATAKKQRNRSKKTIAFKS
jgi:hypothetical protein